MKKVVSFLITICIVFAAFPNCAFANNVDRISLDEFCEQVTDMLDEDENGIDKSVNSRVIIKADGKINQLDAVESVEGYKDYHILEFSNEKSAEDAIDYYSKNKNVKSVEKDSVYSVDAFVEDAPDGYLSYASEEMGFSQLFEYLNNASFSFSDEVTVAVIDTGIEYEHDFLRGRTEDSGYNFSDSGESNSSNDDNGHGTHVAGIIKDNTPDNVKIKGYKVLNSEGKGSTVSVILGMEQAIADGVGLINMSLGAKKENNDNEDAMHAVIQEAYEKEIPIIASAGNEGDKAEKYSPAGYEECITVMACGTISGGIADYSNYGDICDISACGTFINSSYINNSYKTLSGTSMAAPYVSASVALLMLLFDFHNSDDIVNYLLERAIPVQHTLAYNVFHNYTVKGSALYVEYLSRELKSLNEPQFSIEGGEFDRNFELTISSPDDADIYYLINDNLNIFRYKQPIQIKYDTQIRAFCTKKGCKWSNVIQQNYKRIFTDEESEYDIDENGVITAYYNDESSVSVPAEINGITVTGIGTGVFSGKCLCEIIIPSSIKNIGNYAFSSCSNLTSFYSDSVETLGLYVFSNCGSLINVHIPKVKDVKYGSFSNCSNLEGYDFNGVESIGHRAFEQCSKIYSCSSDSVTSVGSYAFYKSGLEYVDLPGLNTVESNCFQSCTELETAYLSNVNEIELEAFRSCAKLVNTDLSMCRCIHGEAFYFCSSLKTLDLPEFVLGYSGDSFQFANCISLESINLPKLKTINKRMFAGCSLLTELYLPSMETVEKEGFVKSSVEYVYAPKAKVLYDLPHGENACITVGSSFTGGNVTPNESLVINGIKGTIAESYAAEKGLEFISVDAMGATIRLSDAGLRFGFSFYDSFGKEAEEYGFVYAYENTDELDIEKNKKKVALNTLNNNGITTYNLVFTNIPIASYEREISVKAYIKINGRYLYSDIVVRSFKGVATAVLEDNTIDLFTKEKVKSLLEA